MTGGVVYTDIEVHRHVERARKDGIRLSSTASAFVFMATSSEDPNTLAYRIVVTPGETVNAALCNCQAGQRGVQCKHGASAISAVQLRSVREAAQILARHGARKRAVTKAIAA